MQPSSTAVVPRSKPKPCCSNRSLARTTTLFTYSLKPVAVCRPHVNKAAETVCSRPQLHLEPEG
eukprot:82400-Chlamydomonas_euryale.AAC.1